jgi:hypothetical protein
LFDRAGKPTTWVTLLLLVALGAPARAEHASSRQSSEGGRGATQYNRNETVSKILNNESIASLRQAGSDAVKQLSESSSKSLEMFRQIASQSPDVGKQVVEQLAQAIPDASTLTPDPAAFDGLAKDAQALQNLSIQILQAQANAVPQDLPPPVPADTRLRATTVAERIGRQPRGRPPGSNPSGNPNGWPGDFGGAPTRWPAAYNAPKGF